MGFLSYLSIRIFSCLLVGPFMGGAHATGCHFPDWLNYQGHCYGYFSEELSWEEADRSCEIHRWHLASIENVQIHDALVDFLIKMGVYQDVWIEQPFSEETSDRKLVDFCPVLAKTLGFKHVKYMPCMTMLPSLCEVDL